MSNERWLPVPGYEGLYEVSDMGRVRSLVLSGDRGTKHRTLVLQTDTCRTKAHYPQAGDADNPGRTGS
jgi:hypothetical protein